MNKDLKPKIIVSHRIHRIFAILFPVFLILFPLRMSCDETEAIYGINCILIIITFIVSSCSFLMALGLKKLTYTLQENKITSHYSFIWNYSATVAYKDIKEIELSQGIFQRKFNVGSVIITTNATKERAGFEIYNIENYQEVYDFLSKKVAESKRLQDS